MKNKKRLVFNCACGCGRQTATLHEIVPGSGNRDICIDYNIQLPLCMDCHTVAHLRSLLAGNSPLEEFTKKQNGTVAGLDNELIQGYLFGILGVDMYAVLRALSPSNSKEYLEEIKDSCKIIIMSFAIC